MNFYMPGGVFHISLAGFPSPCFYVHVVCIALEMGEGNAEIHQNQYKTLDLLDVVFDLCVNLQKLGHGNTFAE